MDSVDQKVTSTLQRIHIFRPLNSISMAATVATLHDYLQEAAPTDQCRLLIFDSISAFHWQDRQRMETAVAAHRAAFITTIDGESSPKPPAPVHAMKHLIQAIADFRALYAPVTIFSNWALQGSGLPFYAQHLAPPFPTSFYEGAPGLSFQPNDPINRPLELTHQLVLRSSDLQQMDSRASLKDALGELGAQHRKQVAENKHVVGHLRFVGSRPMEVPTPWDFKVISTGIET